MYSLVTNPHADWAEQWRVRATDNANNLLSQNMAVAGGCLHQVWRMENFTCSFSRKVRLKWLKKQALTETRRILKAKAKRRYFGERVILKDAIWSFISWRSYEILWHINIPGNWEEPENKQLCSSGIAPEAELLSYYLFIEHLAAQNRVKLFMHRLLTECRESESRLPSCAVHARNMCHIPISLNTKQHLTIAGIRPVLGGGARLQRVAGLTQGFHGIDHYVVRVLRAGKLAAAAV